MKATGEVMSIDRTLEGALLKAVRSLEIGLNHLELPDLAKLDDVVLRKKLHAIDDERLFVIAEALRQHSGNLTRTAEALRVPKTTLHDKIRRHGLGS